MANRGWGVGTRLDNAERKGLGLITIGTREFPYRVRESDRARRKRIELTPDGVDVVVPAGSEAADVEAFVHSKRRWLVEKSDEIREEVARLRARTPEGLHSGAKILFRDRFLRLRVESAEVGEPELTYRTAFHVRVPRGTPAPERDAAVRRLLTAWMDERLTEDAWDVVHRRGRPHGLEPRDVRIKEQRTLWGSCGRDRVLRLDRKLARVPKLVFEYVVAHELCHLEHRDHSEAFWALLRRVLPDYEERKAWLETHEVRVG